jgi:hypothetical protein
MPAFEPGDLKSAIAGAFAAIGKDPNELSFTVQGTIEYHDDLRAAPTNAALVEIPPRRRSIHVAHPRGSDRRRFEVAGVDRDRRPSLRSCQPCRRPVSAVIRRSVLSAVIRLWVGAEKISPSARS